MNIKDFNDSARNAVSAYYTQQADKAQQWLHGDHPVDYKLPNTHTAMGMGAIYYSYIEGVSGSRGAMLTSQLAQVIQVCGAELPHTLTGYESQQADYCFGVKTPCEMRVHAVLHKYHSTDGVIRQNPRTSVVYQDLDYDGPGERYGLMQIDSHVKTHNDFGWPVRYTEAAKQLAEGSIIPKNTVMTHSSNIHYNYGMPQYGAGINVNMACISDHATIEDGFEISDTLLRKMHATTIGESVTESGSRRFHLKMNGDDPEYKICPDIGSRVPASGILVATRAYDPYLACIDMSPKYIKKVDLVFDRPVYVKSGSKVIDIDIVSSANEGRVQTISDSMSEQYRYYADHISYYSDQLIDLYNQLMRDGGDSVHRTPKLQNALVAAYADKPNDPRASYGMMREGRIRRVYRAASLDEFRVSVKFESEFVPGLSTKMTGLAGDKGVVCAITPEDKMPIDQWGNRVHLKVYGRTAIARLNSGWLYEPQINAHSRDVLADIMNMLEEDGNDTTRAYEHLSAYYAIINPPAHLAFNAMPIEGRDTHFGFILKEGVIRHNIPAASDWVDLDIYARLEKFRVTNLGPLTYVNTLGETIVTKSKILVGSKYFYILEKSGTKAMATAGVRLQHHGMPSVTNRILVATAPSKERAPRAYGESEFRVVASVVGAEGAAHLHDLSTNPACISATGRAIALAKDPSNMKYVVDRNKIPLGNSRPIALVNHLLSCYGIAITKPHTNK